MLCGVDRPPRQFVVRRGVIILPLGGLGFLVWGLLLAASGAAPTLGVLLAAGAAMLLTAGAIIAVRGRRLTLWPSAIEIVDALVTRRIPLESVERFERTFDVDHGPAVAIKCTRGTTAFVIESPWIRDEDEYRVVVEALVELYPEIPFRDDCPGCDRRWSLYGRDDKRRNDRDRVDKDSG